MYMELKTVEKLISLIRERPSIYGPRPKRGKKRHQKILDDLWKDIASLMNRPVRECKLKWTTLRNCYARLLREERCHKVKKRHWHLRNEMSFLRGHIQPYAETISRSSTRTVSLTHSKIPTDSSTTNYSFDENTLPSRDQPNETSTNNKDVIQNPLGHVESNERLNNFDQEHSPAAEENETISCCPVINLNPFSLPQRISETAEDISQHPKNKDEHSEANILFLRSLLPDINKLSDRKQRIFKRKTLEVLEDLFDEDDFDNHRDENCIVRQCQISRSNYNVQQQHPAIVSEKFIQKIEPTN